LCVANRRVSSEILEERRKQSGKKDNGNRAVSR